MEWIKYSEEKPFESNSYLVYWHQHQYNNGFVVLNYDIKSDRWIWPGIYDHIAVNYVSHWAYLDRPE